MHCLRVVRLKCERPVKVLDGEIVVAMAHIGVAAIGHRCNEARIELDGLRVIVDRQLIVALLAVDIPTMIERLGIIWIEADRLIEVCNCLAIVAVRA